MGPRCGREHEQFPNKGGMGRGIPGRLSEGTFLLVVVESHSAAGTAPFVCMSTSEATRRGATFAACPAETQQAPRGRNLRLETGPPGKDGQRARASGAACVGFRADTPGSLLGATDATVRK